MTGALLPPSSSRDAKRLEQRVTELERRLGNDPTDRRRPKRIVTPAISAAYGGQSIPSLTDTDVVFSQPPFLGINTVYGSGLLWSATTGIGAWNEATPAWVIVGVTVSWNNYGQQGTQRSVHLVHNGTHITDDHEEDEDGPNHARRTWAFPLLLERDDTFNLVASHDVGFDIQISSIRMRAVKIG
jgi:hypothetical protein